MAPGSHETTLQQPRLDPAGAERLAAALYGITGRASQLPSERDCNFRIDGPDGTTHVLKVFNEAENPEFIHAQARTMRLLHGRVGPVFPLPAAALTGALTTSWHSGAAQHAVWLQPFLPGTVAAEVKDLHKGLLEDAGRTLGKMTAVLTRHDEPAARRQFAWTADSAPDVIRAGLKHLPAARRTLLENVLAGFTTHTAPRLAELRRSLIHNDVNDHNLLVHGDRVSGILDFGDMVESFTVCDPAHALAYLLLDRGRPLEIIRVFLGAWTREFPLPAVELPTVYDFVRLRLALSVTMSARQQALRPDDPYLSVSEAAAWRLLERFDTGSITRRAFTAVGGAMT